jgi:hypothetical protein
VWCTKCGIGVRNRQALFRHQRKSHIGTSPSVLVSPLNIPTMDMILDEVFVSYSIHSSELIELFAQLDLKTPSVVKGRYLSDIGEMKETDGILHLINKLRV